MVLLAAPLIIAAAPALAQDAFQAGLARFEQGDASLDARALRWQNRARLGGTVPEWDQAQSAWATIERDPARSLAMAQAQRAIDPLNLNALYLEEQALPRLGRADEARLRHAQILILLRGITGGQDGATRERAWNVVSAAEKDTALALLGFTVTGEETRRDGGHAYAVITATPPMGGQAMTIWIGVDALVPAP
ncbi:hypothetical protein C8K11_108157 [Novosphingobium sp. GV055]|nr:MULTISPECIES: hypothetical protein [unclassified Novosphingobium]PTR09865.1 hypothetical protein C8K11_108157 [Novosphingobium sp. GV055]PUB02652.1 hypothetical protein C8K12_108157 [Novosphingobium sp. GV061]PUB19597.1 hypothetical protein C8K14_108157 [Novosphingobium sp. GV079]PUB41021.1 hypothetical protein C8K10_108157 [Novosphingobium sp. GV027]